MYWKGIALLKKDTCEENKLHSPELLRLYLKETIVFFQSCTMDYPVDWHSSQGLEHPTDGNCCVPRSASTDSFPSCCWLSCCLQSLPLAPVVRLSFIQSLLCHNYVRFTASGLACSCLLWLPRDSILETAL